MEWNNMNTMGEWEQEKAMYLIRCAHDLGMDTSTYGELAVNPNSGYTYLWLEDYPFTLHMPINCELKKEDVWAMWTNPDNGDEEEITLSDHSLNDLYEWVKDLEQINA